MKIVLIKDSANKFGLMTTEKTSIELRGYIRMSKEVSLYALIVIPQSKAADQRQITEYKT